MMDAYTNDDAEGFLNNSIRHVIIAIDNKGEIGVMMDNLPENMDGPENHLTYIGLIHQGLEIISRDIYPYVAKESIE